MYKIMIRDNMSPRAKEVFEQTGKISVVIDNDKATGVPEKLAEIIEDYDGIAIRSGTTIDPSVLAREKN